MRRNRINLYHQKRSSQFSVTRFLVKTTKLTIVIALISYGYAHKTEIRQFISMSRAKAIPTIKKLKFEKAPKLAVNTETKDAFEKLASDQRLKNFIFVQNGSDIQLQFYSRDYFVPGRAEIKKEKVRQISYLANSLKALNSHWDIKVESHTDDIPVVHNKDLYRTNWELSAYRTFTVIHMLEQAGFKKKQLFGVGYGESRPLFPNKDANGNPIPSNQYKNGRVLITLSTKIGERR